ncbi:SAM-dependent RNA methyltransferase [Phaeosphaeriaceae sp. PMI808]|nr:SAM-dependent RNA methyltransferase [Phaeosphaeriaceae sp. PMI808]
MSPTGKTYVVEHLDPELEAWSSLEYSAIAKESYDSGAKFILSSVPPSLQLPENLQNAPGLTVETRSIEEIYANQKERVCLLDPAASTDLHPRDSESFDIFLFGGILGDDPPRDRTSELRKKGYQGRRLGPLQMTTDTAVRVTRMIVQSKLTYESIPFIDNPEIRINKNESTQMPFRYVQNVPNLPVMPEGMLDLIIKDSGKSLDGLL